MPITFKETKLDNGLTILAEIDPQAQSVGAGFFVKTGARDEDPALMGVSHFLEHMMFKGTDDLSADELNQAFDDIGANNNAYTTREMTCFYAHVIKEQSGRAIELLSRMMRPALRRDDFETEKGVILEEIAMYADNPFWVLYEQAVDTHYQGHGLGHRVLGTNETISAMSLESMRGYFTDRYSADNTCVALSGAIDFDRAVDQIRENCSTWNISGADRAHERPTTHSGAFVESSARVNRGYVLGIADAPSIDSDARYSAALLAQILGGTDNSRLHWALIETGLADEALCSYDGLDGAGDFFIYSSGDPERLDEIWGIVEAQISGLRESINGDDLAKLRAKMLTSVTLSGERPSGRMQRLGRLWAASGGYLSLEEEIARIDAVTVDSVRDVLDRYPLYRCTLGRMVPERVSV